MSTITVLFDMQNVTSVQYDQVIQGLEAAGAGNPKGRRFHFASPKDGGWLVIDIWESGELLNQFAQTLIPVMQEAGVAPPQPQVFPLHNVITG